MGRHAAADGVPTPHPLVAEALAARPGEGGTHRDGGEQAGGSRSPGSDEVGWPAAPAPGGGGLGWPADAEDSAAGEPVRPPAARRGWRRLLGGSRVA